MSSKNIENETQKLLQTFQTQNFNSQLTLSSQAECSTDCVTPTTENVLPAMPTKKDIQTGEIRTVQKEKKITTYKLKYDKNPKNITLESNPYPSELEIYPVRCYTCGKPFYSRILPPEKSLEESAQELLSAGMPVNEFLDLQKLERMCCRVRILESPLTVSLLKSAEKNKPDIITSRLALLNLNNTSADQQLNPRIVSKTNNNDDDDDPIFF